MGSAADQECMMHSCTDWPMQLKLQDKIGMAELDYSL